MKKPLMLSKEEQIYFMRSLYSVFMIDYKLHEVEQGALGILETQFDISKDLYSYPIFKNTEEIANEINKIKDFQVRRCFMHMIHEVYHEIIKGFFSGPNTEEAKLFRKLYDDLKIRINLE
ncbi:hypothetical protein [Methylotuvimicrobium sp. KM1]|uniref:hypothetical protein n=1 Tax=Methylotuvimicrobium sp. KM1 TaxID=3377707 RepID=UPI0038511BEF